MTIPSAHFGSDDDECLTYTGVAVETTQTSQEPFTSIATNNLRSAISDQTYIEGLKQLDKNVPSLARFKLSAFCLSFRHFIDVP